MSLQEAVESLYSGDPDDFVRRRKELAAEARSQKDRATSAAIAGLRRPTRGAWLVNLLARTEPERISALVGLGGLLTEAHRAADVAQVRALTDRRRREVASLVERAEGLGLHRGYEASVAVREEVGRALEAAVLDLEVARQVVDGVLVAAPRVPAAFPTHLFEGLVPPAANDQAEAKPASGDDAPAPGLQPGWIMTPFGPIPDPAAQQTEPAPSEVSGAGGAGASSSPAGVSDPGAARADVDAAERRAEEAADALASARSRVREADAALATRESEAARAVAARTRAEAERDRLHAAAEAAREALALAEAAERAGAEAAEAASSAADAALAAAREARQARSEARREESDAGAAALAAEAAVVEARAALEG